MLRVHGLELNLLADLEMFFSFLAGSPIVISKKFAVLSFPARHGFSFELSKRQWRRLPHAVGQKKACERLRLDIR